MKLTSIILTACLLAVPMGCKKATLTNPAVLAPGYTSQADQTLGQTLKGIHDFYVRLQADAAAGTWTPTPTEKTGLNSLWAALNIADSTYLAYHGGTATLAQAQTAVNSAITAQTAIQNTITAGGK